MSRSYQIDDNKYPSVTTLLSEVGNKDGLIQWAANCTIDYIRDHFEDLETGRITWQDINLDEARKYYKEKSQEAMDIGSIVHDNIENYIKAYLSGNTNYIANINLGKPEAVRGMLAFMKWEKENKFVPYASEMTVYSHKHKYAGTLDCLCWINGKVYVIDFKTSKSHDVSHSLQIAAYRKALIEMNTDLPTPQGCGILRLDKETGEPDWKDYSDKYRQHWKSFKGILQYYYNLRNRRLK